MKSRALLAVTLAAGLMATLPASARADVVVATVRDHRDAPRTASGKPAHPDIRRVDATYDSRGSLTITTTFFTAPAALKNSRLYAYRASFQVGVRGQNDTCGPGFDGLVGEHHVLSRFRPLRNFARVYPDADGPTLRFRRTGPGKTRRVSITATSPRLADHDYECVWLALWKRTLSTEEHPNSRYDERCDCWFLEEDVDEPPILLFREPPPPPPPPPAPPPPKTRVYVQACPGAAPVRRPGRLSSCADAGLGLVGLRWRSWGVRAARGTARYRENVCAPDCVRERYRYYRLERVELSEPRPCRETGKWHFRRLVYVFADRRPDWMRGRRQTERLPCGPQP